jgi:hypothetical protein
MWIDPATGAIRVLDQRTYTNYTLTMGTDPIAPTALSRDVGDCFQRVEVRGQPDTPLALLKLSLNQLTEHFAHDGLTSAQAKLPANWSPKDFTGTTHYQDVGTCTCPSTTTVTVTSTNTSYTWTSNYWDQTSTGNKGVINLTSTVVTGVDALWTARIVANTALTAGGTSTLTIDAPLPGTTFDRYTISGFATGASIVYRDYQIADTTLWNILVPQANFPQPFKTSGGGSSLVSTPQGMVLYSQSSGGGPPYNMVNLPFIYKGNGVISFAQPTYVVAQNAAPADVWVLTPLNRGTKVVYSPQNSGGSPVYAGTSRTVEGLSDTLTVTVTEWRDPANKAAIQAYADDLLDSVKDARIEGTIMYLGLYEPALTMGISLSIAASGYTVPYGWGSANLPVVECELEFGGATLHTTHMRCSNRRDPYSAGQFMHPDRTGITWGPPDGNEPMVLGGATFGGNTFDAAMGQQASLNPQNQDMTIPTSLEAYGVPTSMDQLGLPTGLGDFGVPTSLADLGVPGSMGDYFGGGMGGGMGGGGGPSNPAAAPAGPADMPDLGAPVNTGDFGPLTNTADLGTPINPADLGDFGASVNAPDVDMSSSMPDLEVPDIDMPDIDMTGGTP